MNCDIGLIGLAVMGENLALNIESRGYSVAVFNRTISKVDDFIDGRAKGKNFVGCHSLEELVKSLSRAAQSDDDGQGRPGRRSTSSSNSCRCFARATVIIDGGNTLFTDTERRTQYVESKGLLYIGTGVSGGEEGALKGPSMMPGGSEAAWPLVKPIFQAIAAKVGPNNDIPCCEWVGPRGAGHYVKMVHNGIEYGDMQLICEAYCMLKYALGLTTTSCTTSSHEWNEGELDSYLIEITRDIFSVKDPDTGKLPGRHDSRHGRRQGHGQMDEPVGARPRRAEHTGDRGGLCPLPVGAERSTRVRASKVLKGPTAKFDGDRSEVHRAVRQALYASKICSYAQGFVQIAGRGQGAQLAAGFRQHRPAVARRLHHSRGVS